MSVESMNYAAIELSTEELDAVAGGAITEDQNDLFSSVQNDLFSTFDVGPNGVHSVTLADQTKNLSKGIKKVTLT